MTAATKRNIHSVAIDAIKPSPENDDIYNGINQNREDFKELVHSVGNYGIIEPIHITQANFILSGHRRFAAAKKVGLSKIPVICQSVLRSAMKEADYRRVLAQYNAQRVKTSAERVREQMARSQPKAHQQIIAERMKASQQKTFGNVIETSGKIQRSKISNRLKEFLNAVIDLTFRAKSDWPISSRSVHYWLLDIQPLTNSCNGKQRHRYANDQKKLR